MSGPYPNDQSNPAGAIPSWQAAVPGGVATTFRQTTTTSAAALASHAFSSGFTVKALSTNAAIVYVGGSGVTSSTGYPLSAGDSISYTLANSGSVYIVGGNTTDVVAVTGN